MVAASIQFLDSGPHGTAALPDRATASSQGILMEVMDAAQGKLGPEDSWNKDRWNPTPIFFRLPRSLLFPYLEVMDVHLNNPEIQAKIDRWVTETGRGPDELIEDAVAGYFEELTQTRETLNSRYDDLKSGKVKPISGDEVIAHFRQKSAARRSPPGSSRVPSNDK